MRATASVLHLDADAFFAGVEVLSKPSLRGKPVVVGGLGPRGVVATSSYEARAYGVRSAMSMAEARSRLPGNAAYLAPRFAAYQQVSSVVMGLLRELSPLVEPVSLDEAYVDLAHLGLGVPEVSALATGLRERIRVATGGLTASVGIGTSKVVAKVASDACKPDGLLVVPPGEETALLHPLPVRALHGVGPATAAKLARLGVQTVGQLAALEPDELVRLLGQAHGRLLHELAWARDPRPVAAESETKSVSVETTFDVDVVSRERLGAVVVEQASRVAARLAAAGTAGRTVVLKARYADFTTVTRSLTLGGATASAPVVVDAARRLLDALPVEGGFRLLGVGVAGLTDFVQGDLLAEGSAPGAVTEAGAVAEVAEPEVAVAPDRAWRPGQDVVHASWGAGWVWGAGHGRVTVRFEGPGTPPGPVRTFAVDDPGLEPAPPPVLPPLNG